MKKTVDFYFDFGSPTTYLANTQLVNICKKYNAELNYQPALLGGIFKATGNQSPVMLAPKAVYMMTDLQRYANRYDVTLNMNPFFPINTLQLMRMAVAVMHYLPEQTSHYIETVFKAIWVDELNMGDMDVVAAALEKADLDIQQLMTWASEDLIKNKLKETTEQAVARGAYGAPTMYIGEEMYFGQDRLDFIEEALSK